MSILLIFQVVCIIQHLMLYPIDTNIIITHIFHFPSLTYFSSMLYFTSLYCTCHMNRTCNFQPVLIFFSFLKFSLFCFFSLNSNSLSSSILPPYLIILSNFTHISKQFNYVCQFNSIFFSFASLFPNLIFLSLSMYLLPYLNRLILFPDLLCLYYSQILVFF